MKNRRRIAYLSLLVILITTLTETVGGQSLFPATQFIGTSQTLIEVRGASKTDKGYINKVYTDTTDANLDTNHIKMYRGSQMVTQDNNFWIRNYDATQWLVAGLSGITVNNGLTLGANLLQISGPLVKTTTVLNSGFNFNIAGPGNYNSVAFAPSATTIVHTTGGGVSPTDRETVFYQPGNLITIVGTTKEARDSGSYYARSIITSEAEITGNAFMGSYYPTQNDPFSAPAVVPNKTTYVKVNQGGGGTTGLISLYGKTLSIDGDSIKVNPARYATGVGYVLTDQNGDGILTLRAGGLPYTADNGITLTGTNFQLGGALTQNTTITSGSTNTLLITGDPSISLQVSNTKITGVGVESIVSGSSGAAFYGIATTNGLGGLFQTGGGDGILSQAGAGTGVHGTSTAGYAGKFDGGGVAANNVYPNFQISRVTSGTPANGIGSSIDFTEPTSTTTSIANQIISKWTDVTNATRTSEYSITGVNSAATATLLTISGNGQTRLNKYGVGTFTGTPTFTASFDANGNIIETSLQSDSTLYWSKAGNVAASGSTFLGTLTNTSLRIRTNNIQRMIVDSVGFVGIGTASPAYKLEVTDAVNSTISQFNGPASGDSYIRVAQGAAGLNLGYSSTAGVFSFINSSGTALSLYTNAGANRAMTLYNSNVGIGIAIPVQTLDILVNANSGNTINVKNNSTGTVASGGIQVGNSATAGSLFKTSTGYTPYRTINPSDLGFYNSGAGNISVLNDYASGNINFAAGASSTVQLTIASTGNVTVGPGIFQGSTSNYATFGDAASGGNKSVFIANGYLGGANFGTTPTVGSKSEAIYIDLNGTGTVSRPFSVYQGGFGANPAAGNGVGIEYNIYTTTTKKVAGATDVLYTTASAGAEVSDFKLSLLNAGTLAEKVRVTGTGNVGIATTVPGYQLEVKGTGAATDGIFINTSAYTSIPNPGSVADKAILSPRGFNFSFDGATISSGYRPEGGIAIAEARSAPIMALKNTVGPSLLVEAGNVGIGTSAPLNKLQLDGSGATLGIVFDVTQGSIMGHNLYYSSGFKRLYAGTGVSLVNYADGGTTNADISFYQEASGTANSAISFTVPTLYLKQSNLNVGIQTTAPTAKLHIAAGTATASTAPLKFTSGTLNTTAEAGAVEFLTDAYYGTITTGAARKTFAFLESPAFTGTATAAALTVTGNFIGVNGNNGGVRNDAFQEMQVVSGATTLAFNNNANNSRYMTIVNSTGFVGIGDASPAALLTVGSGDLFQVNGSGNATFSGKISGPYWDATVGAVANKTVVSMTSGGSQFGTIQAETTAGSGAWSLGYQSSASVTIGTPVLTWTGSALVGIGTTAPGAKLGINQTSSTATQLILSNNANSTGAYQEIAFQYTQTDASFGSKIRSTQVLGSAYGTLLQFMTENTGGTQSIRMTLDQNGFLGIGTTAPFDKLANTSLNISDVAGVGVSGAGSLDWLINAQGYTQALYNNSTGSVANGLLVKIAGTATTNKAFTVNTAATSTTSGTDIFTVLGTGNVGIGQTTPTAYLHIKAGTAAASTAPIKLTVASSALLTSPEIGSIEVLKNRLYYTDSTVTRYIIHAGGTPTIAAGAGAGTSPTISITGIDEDGYISITTGTIPTLSAIVATVTFSSAYGATPKYVNISPANTITAALTGLGMVYVDQAGITTTTFDLTAGATALTAATAYKWYYRVMQ